MIREISSWQTVLMKIIFPLLWIPIFGLGGIVALFGSTRGGSFFGFQFVLLWLAGSFFIYWYCIRLKVVSIDENKLYISNYFKTISVPLSQIRDVTENMWINIHPVTVHLKSPSEFGSKIVFMPKTRYFTWFTPHPIVEELLELAAKKQELPDNAYSHEFKNRHW